MHFPVWIDAARHSRLKRAQLRLKFILNMAALIKYGRTSIHDIARDIGCDHSSIFNAIRRGYFTCPMAERLEQHFGTDLVRAEWLVDPLAIEEIAA